MVNHPSQKSVYLFLDRGVYKRLVDSDAGGRLNKKDGLTSYGDSHVKDKTS